MNNQEKRPYILKPVIKPLDAEDHARSQQSEFRDITEDDDGYHPYADVPDTRPLFEENPWD